MTKAFLTIIFIIAALLPARSANSDFDSGVQGWSVVSFANIASNNFSIIGTYPATFATTGGNPGGYLSSQDPDGGDFVFSAPTEYLGNQSGSLGGIFSYDIFHIGSINIQGADVIIEGGGIRLVWQSDPPLTPTNVWQHVSLSLSPSPQWHVGATGGVVATQSDFAAVLSGVTAFYVRGEYTSGSETAGLDNVFFQRVSQGQPVPAAIYQAAEITWSSVSGKTYQVQATYSLDTPVWADFGVPVAGNGTELSVFDKTRNVIKRFYRVIEVQ